MLLHKCKVRLLFALVVLALASVSFGATMSVAPGGTLTAQALDDGLGNLTFDIRGTAVAQISNPTLLGPVILADPGAGAFGNSVLLAVNAGVTEAGAVVFDFPSVAIVSGTSLSISAIGVPLAPVTDPALLAFLGSSPYRFTFDFTSAVAQTGGGTLSSFALASITGQSVPEPGTLSMVLAGGALALLGLNLRRK